MTVLSAVLFVVHLLLDVAILTVLLLYTSESDVEVRASMQLCACELRVCVHVCVCVCACVYACVRACVRVCV